MCLAEGGIIHLQEDSIFLLLPVYVHLIPFPNRNLPDKLNPNFSSSTRNVDLGPLWRAVTLESVPSSRTPLSSSLDDLGRGIGKQRGGSAAQGLIEIVCSYVGSGTHTEQVEFDLKQGHGSTSPAGGENERGTAGIWSWGNWCAVSVRWVCFRLFSLFFERFLFRV